MKAFGLFIEMKQKKKNLEKKAFFVFLGCFWAYVGQPHDHIGWDKSMPFASINPTNPRTNPWNFHEKILRIGGAKKWGLYPFFWVGHFEFFFSRKNYFFCFISMKRPKAFIWGIIYFCNIDGFFRILEKTSLQLICTWL